MVVIKNNTLATRIWSSLVMFIIFILLLYSNNAGFIFLTQIILFLANWELLRMLEYRKKKLNKSSYTNCFLSRCRIPLEDYFMLVFINLFIFSINLSSIFFQIVTITIMICWILININEIKKYDFLIYPSSAFYFLILLRIEGVLIDYLFFIVLFAMLVDMSAFFVGRRVGGKKLAINISPGKTISGSIGGIIFPSIIYSVLYYDINNIHNVIFLTIFLSIISQFGDLLESKFKRFCSVKDSSNLIPGHGGVLDRLDSILLLTIVVSIMKLMDYNFFFIV